jgi:hypothetical protein
MVSIRKTSRHDRRRERCAFFSFHKDLFTDGNLWIKELGEEYRAHVAADGISSVSSVLGKYGVDRVDHWLRAFCTALLCIARPNRYIDWRATEVGIATYVSMDEEIPSEYLRLFRCAMTTYLWSQEPCRRKRSVYVMLREEVVGKAPPSILALVTDANLQKQLPLLAKALLATYDRWQHGEQHITAPTT